MVVDRRLLLITGLAALIRLAILPVESLWYDEAFTAWLVTLPLTDMMGATLNDVHPPTWYLIEWLTVTALGSSVIALRLVSALAGIALIPAIWRLTASLDFPRETRTAATMLTAMAPFAVYYSTEARPYSILMLAASLATIGLVERRWWLLVLAGSLALWLHNLAGLYLVALGWLAVYRYRLDWKPLAALTIIGLLWLPWVWLGLLGQLGAVQGAFWISPPELGTIPAMLTQMVFSHKSGWLVMVSAPLVALAMLNSRPRWDLVGLVALPIALAVIVSILIRPIIIARILAPVAPALYLLIAPALVIPGGRPKLVTIHSYALPICFVVVALGQTVAWVGMDKIGRWPWDYQMDDYRQHLRADDGIYHSNAGSLVVMKYYQPNANHYLMPQTNTLYEGLSNETKNYMGLPQAVFDDVACNHRRWWLLFYENPLTTPGEKAAIEQIVADTGGDISDVIWDNDFVYARIYRIEEPCNIYAAHKSY